MGLRSKFSGLFEGNPVDEGRRTVVFGGLTTIALNSAGLHPEKLPSNLVLRAREICKKNIELYRYKNLYYPVSKNQRLPKDFPEDRCQIQTKTFPNHNTGTEVAKIAAPDLIGFLKDVKNAGYNPQLRTGYRDFPTQQTFFNNAVAYEKNLGKAEADAIKSAEQYSAHPGFSEHHLGLAFDIVDKDSVDTSPENFWDDAREHYNEGIYKYMRENAHRFGLVLSYPIPDGEYDRQRAKTGSGYPSNEPWHFRWVGEELATLMYENNYLSPDNELTVDTLLNAVNQGA